MERQLYLLTPRSFTRATTAKSLGATPRQPQECFCAAVIGVELCRQPGLGVCVKPEGRGSAGTGLLCRYWGSRSQAGQAEKGTVRTQQSGNGKVTSQVSSQSRRAKQQFMSSREWDRILHSISWAGKNGPRLG